MTVSIRIRYSRKVYQCFRCFVLTNVCENYWYSRHSIVFFNFYGVALSFRKMPPNFVTDIDEGYSSDRRKKFYPLLMSIVSRWEDLQMEAVRRQRHSTQLRLLQSKLSSMRLALEKHNQSLTSLSTADLESSSVIGNKLNEAKDLLKEIEECHGDLSSLNILVHRFITDSGLPFASLKEDVKDLYCIWEDTNRRSSDEVSRLENFEATFLLWEEQEKELKDALRKDKDTLKVLDLALANGTLTDVMTASANDVSKLLNERRGMLLKSGGLKALATENGTGQSSLFSSGLFKSGDKGILAHTLRDGSSVFHDLDHMSDSGTSGYESCSSDDLSERERRLAHLKRLAKDMEKILGPGSKVVQDIEKNLSEAENELKGLQQHCRDLIVRTAGKLDPVVMQQPSTTHLSLPRRRNNPKMSPRMERKNRSRASKSPDSRPSSGSNSSGWFRRVVRAAIPFQASLLLLLLIACLLAPNCCDSMNTFNVSLSPQFRFVHGSSPV